MKGLGTKKAYKVLWILGKAKTVDCTSRFTTKKEAIEFAEKANSESKNFWDFAVLEVYKLA